MDGRRTPPSPLARVRTHASRVRSTRRSTLRACTRWITATTSTSSRRCCRSATSHACLVRFARTMAHSPLTCCLVLDGVNTDSGERHRGCTFEGIDKFEVDKVRIPLLCVGVRTDADAGVALPCAARVSREEDAAGARCDALRMSCELRGAHGRHEGGACASRAPQRCFASFRCRFAPVRWSTSRRRSSATWCTWKEAVVTRATRASAAQVPMPPCCTMDTRAPPTRVC